MLSAWTTWWSTWLWPADDAAAAAAGERLRNVSLQVLSSSSSAPMATATSVANAFDVVDMHSLDKAVQPSMPVPTPSAIVVAAVNQTVRQLAATTTADYDAVQTAALDHPANHPNHPDYVHAQHTTAPTTTAVDVIQQRLNAVARALLDNWMPQLQQQQSTTTHNRHQHSNSSSSSSISSSTFQLLNGGGSATSDVNDTGVGVDTDSFLLASADFTEDELLLRRFWDNATALAASAIGSVAPPATPASPTLFGANETAFRFPFGSDFDDSTVANQSTDSLWQLLANGSGTVANGTRSNESSGGLLALDSAADAWLLGPLAEWLGLGAEAQELAVGVLTSVVLGLIILATVLGNAFVIIAILVERNLQSVANYLIMSLAVADMLVAVMVMPFGAVYQVSDEWTMGPEVCDVWTSSDVLCCTASILHLVSIALDRYWAVTDIDYMNQRTGRRIGVMIAIVWTLSVLVAIAPLFGWKDPEWSERIDRHECMVSQDIGYQIFATASSFYVPLLVILVLYWRIFQTARKRIRKRQQVGGAITATPGGLIATTAGGTSGIAACVITIIGKPLPTISETTTAFTNCGSSSVNNSPEKGAPKIQPDSRSMVQQVADDPPTADYTSGQAGCFTVQQQQPQRPATPPPPQSQAQQKKAARKKAAADSKRERKAAKTLAIITGAFVCCWLPFFILALLLPTCGARCVPAWLTDLFLWLGYFNSTLNPIIYTIFSPEFRNAFKRILCGKKRNIQRQTGVMRR